MTASIAVSETRQRHARARTIIASMTTSYEMRAIAPEVLSGLRDCDDAGNVPRIVVDDGGGSPLRCCLGRSKPGEAVGLVSYAPLRRWAAQTGARPGPYNEVGPVFIHLDDCGGAAPEVARGEFPEGVRGKRRVLRAYNAAGSILGGRLVEEDGDPAIEDALEEVYLDPAVAVVHVRAVEFGCFLMETRRSRASFVY
jgi:hypothetical protein